MSKNHLLEGPGLEGIGSEPVEELLAPDLTLQVFEMVAFADLRVASQTWNIHCHI